MDSMRQIVLSNRSFLYFYIARVFAGRIDSSFLARMKECHTLEEMLICDSWTNLECDEYSLSELHSDLATQFFNRGQCGGTSDTLWDLECAFTRIFIGPGKPLVSLYESTYVNKEQLVFQQSTLDVRNAYAAFGLKVLQKRHEPDDHIGSELAFMAHLGQRAFECGVNKDDRGMIEALQGSLSFLDNHLLRWIDAFYESFLRAVKVDPISSFYLNFALMVKVVVWRDKCLLQTLIQDVNR